MYVKAICIPDLHTYLHPECYQMWNKEYGGWGKSRQFDLSASRINKDKDSHYVPDV